MDDQRGKCIAGALTTTHVVGDGRLVEITGERVVCLYSIGRVPDLAPECGKCGGSLVPWACTCDAGPKVGGIMDVELNVAARGLVKRRTRKCRAHGSFGCTAPGCR